MKKMIWLILLFIPLKGEWVYLSTNSKKAFEIKVISSNIKKTKIKFRLNKFIIKRHKIEGKNYSKIEVPGMVHFLKKGFPELPTIGKNIAINDYGRMGIRILSIKYEVFKIDPVMPSKGNIYRNTDPQYIPYVFDEFYNTNSWFPEKTVEISEPFILRDIRGVNVKFNPFQYNPKKKELKVIKEMTIEVYETEEQGKNPLLRKRNKLTREFYGIYKNLFLNFNLLSYDTLSEKPGKMLIITADEYMDELEEFIKWKKKKGIKVNLAKISEIGNNENSIKQRIQAEYDSTNLVWVLLVGDGNEITPATGTIGSASGEDADPVYAYTAGNDYFPDIFISRFSSRDGNPLAITNQVKRSINYERYPEQGESWYHTQRFGNSK